MPAAAAVLGGAANTFASVGNETRLRMDTKMSRTVSRRESQNLADGVVEDRVLQYRWVGELSELGRQHMQDSLRAAGRGVRSGHGGH